jgi:DNA-binding transcriptional LysR family regulator
VEFRQLHYFVTLAEELHFGRAAAREHIVQSALSQQIQRLERELGTALVERSTHHVRLTPAGNVLLIEARDILGHVDRAMAATRAAPAANAIVRVAVGDPSFDSMPRILATVRGHHPRLEVHQIEACAPEQYRLLAERRLDVGIGRASNAPAWVASEVVRLDPLGVLVSEGHQYAQRESMPVALLADEPLLFAAEDRAPEVNQFISELCRTAGFSPNNYPGTVQSVRGAAELVREARCSMVVPRSCELAVAGIRWLPLVDPSTCFPWSLLWRAGDETEPTRSILRCARALSNSAGWIAPPVTQRGLLEA